MEFSLEDSRKLKIKELRMQKNKVGPRRKMSQFHVAFHLFFCLFDDVTLRSCCSQRSFPKIATLKRERDRRKHLELQRREAQRKQRPRQGSKERRQVGNYCVHFDLSLF